MIRNTLTEYYWIRCELHAPCVDILTQRPSEHLAWGGPRRVAWTLTQRCVDLHAGGVEVRAQLREGRRSCERVSACATAARGCTQRHGGLALPHVMTSTQARCSSTSLRSLQVCAAPALQLMRRRTQEHEPRLLGRAGRARVVYSGSVERAEQARIESKPALIQ